MAEFVKYYKEKFNIEFISDIPCAAHVINLIFNDIMAELKLKAPKNDEIAIYIENIEKISKKKNRVETPLTYQVNLIRLFIYCYFY